jgi:hypothetical protein
VLLAVAGALMAQAKPGAKPDEKKSVQSKPDTAQTAVDPDDFVVLITGACQTPPGQFAVRDCVRGVTRAEFEKLLAITQPNATGAYKQKLAETLGQVIILSNEAKKRELTKDPDIEELLRFKQMQTLAELLVGRAMKTDAQPTDDEINAYYQSHLDDYQTADFLRIIVPAKNLAAPDDDAKFAETIRARCASGEDVKKLQAEADQRVGRPAAAPVDLKNQQRAMFPQAQRAMFNSMPGECVTESPSKGEFFVYKLVAKSESPTPAAKAAIVNALEGEKIKSELEDLKKQNVVSLNEKYFGPLPSQPKVLTPVPTPPPPGPTAPQ